MYVDDIKLGGKKQNINPTWKILMNMLIWENQHHSLTTFTLVALKEKEKPAKILLTVLNDLCRSYRKIPSSVRLDANTSTWSYDMGGHAKKYVERYCELANETTQQPYKVSTPSLDDHQFKEEEWRSVGELSKVCSQIVLKCLYLARIGRLDILW